MLNIIEKKQRKYENWGLKDIQDLISTIDNMRQTQREIKKNRKYEIRLFHYPLHYLTSEYLEAIDIKEKQKNSPLMNISRET